MLSAEYTSEVLAVSMVRSSSVDGRRPKSPIHTPTIRNIRKLKPQRKKVPIQPNNQPARGNLCRKEAHPARKGAVFLAQKAEMGSNTGRSGDNNCIQRAFKGAAF